MTGGRNVADEKQAVDFLVKVPLFKGLQNRQLERLAKSFVQRQYGVGEAIVTQGEGGEGIFIIVSGAAEAIRERADGTKAVVNTFGPTGFFGELALLDDGLRTASVITTEATQCLVLTRWTFLGMLRQDADMGVVIAQELAKRFRMALDAL
jgi:CRP/FNR family cyclic AMP-dependent transcriptional regulator